MSQKNQSFREQIETLSNYSGTQIFSYVALNGIVKILIDRISDNERESNETKGNLPRWEKSFRDGMMTGIVHVTIGSIIVNTLKLLMPKEKKSENDMRSNIEQTKTKQALNYVNELEDNWQGRMNSQNRDSNSSVISY